MSFMEKLLDGATVEWHSLESLVKIKHGKDWKGLNEGKVPVYGSGGIMGYVDTYAYCKPTVLIPRKGSITNVFYVDTPFWNVDTIYYTDINTKVLVPKYFYYFIKTIDLLALDMGAGRPSLTQAILNKILVPVPCPENPEKSIKIQTEIVRVLDVFTDMLAELINELDMRKKQYSYYRNHLLGFKNNYDVEWKTLGWIGDVRMCKRILKHQTSDVGEVPFFKIGSFGKQPDAYIPRSLFEEYRNKYNYPNVGDVLISASGTIGRAVIFDGKDAYFQDSNIVWIENDESKVLNKYLFYYYQIANWSVSDGGVIKRLYNDNIRKTPILIPYPNEPERSLAEQARIVSLLDKFDTLINSLTEGLPREIELSQKQYEYYRDLLLSFSTLESGVVI